jgi:hypothetical protein
MKIRHISDGLIASQLGPLHENVRIYGRNAMFFGIIPRNFALEAASAAAHPSLASEGAMRETVRT